jgi:hypothetical protein
MLGPSLLILALYMYVKSPTAPRTRPCKIGGGGLTTPKRMDIAPADPAVRDLDVDVVFRPCLWREVLELHVAFYGGGVQAGPAAELGRCGHDCFSSDRTMWETDSIDTSDSWGLREWRCNGKEDRNGNLWVW